MNAQNIIDAFEDFQQLKVLVIGDVILDAYFDGDVNRISPEAPVSVLEVRNRDYRLGGAANVALNLKGLGSEPVLCSVVGDDEAGEQIGRLAANSGLEHMRLVKSKSRRSTVKTRLMSRQHQLMRFDEEHTHVLNEAEQAELTNLIDSSIRENQIHAIVLEDYDKGVLSPNTIDYVMRAAREKNIPVTVDPKLRNFLAYSGATLFKPNLRELRDGLNMQHLTSQPGDLKTAFEALVSKCRVQKALFTLGSEGMCIFSEKGFHYEPARKMPIADVSGAGDSVIAAATCALAAGLSDVEILHLANLAGGWVCQFPGVVPVNAKLLLNLLTEKSNP
ncbi:MAG: D-glycero-beta-D-manno-heptose-7-phosphate kinase [Salibacteraceae bacterium]